MIDIHSHVLPCVDDGADDMDKSLSMVREAAIAGVTDLFLTPHYMRLRDYLSPASKNQEIFNQLKAAVEKEKIPVRLHLGNEIYYSLDILNALRNGIVLPLGKSNKVLIEFSLLQEDEDIIEAIHNIKTIGYVPILAHLERYPYVYKIKDYEVIKQMGALIQVNASSVLGHADRGAHKKAMVLLKNGLADFVASDQHVPGRNHLAEAFDIVRKKFGSSLATVLFENTSVLE